MRKITAAFGVLGTISVLCLSAAPAQALAPVTWISGTGLDTNDCFAPATPCRNFLGATGVLAKTEAGGTIHVLPGNYDTPAITKSVQIIADGGQASIVNVITTSGGMTAGIVINAGPADVVRIRGMIVNPLGGSTFGTAVGFVAGKALHLENCTLIGSGIGAFGIQFAPNAAAAGGAPTELTVRNSTIGSNVSGNVLIRPTSSVAVAALFERVLVGDSIFGVKADNSGGSG